ncbi:MAG: 50S ribosomal protein L25/general stress protein Ctc [Alphaproteobacteria bacterium]
MTNTHELPFTKREGTGTGPARAVRRAGLVPGIVYGGDGDPMSISVEGRALVRAIEQGGFMNSLFELQNDAGNEKVLPRDVQFDVVTDRPLHVDFLRVSDRTIVTIEVPVVFLNEEECPGLKRGGVLNVVRYTIEVNCRANAMPEHLEIDLLEADIGDSLHISAVPLPEGVTPTITDRDFTIATIAAPTVQEESEDEDEEGLEAAGEGEDGEGAEGGDGEEAGESAED